MVESEHLFGQNEVEEGVDRSQKSNVIIVPARPLLDQASNDQKRRSQNLLDEDSAEVQLLNGACNSIRHSEMLPTENSLPIHSDLERNDKFMAEESIPSPVLPGPSPPDGGFRAWMVMIASFLCNGIIFGTINSSGVIFPPLKQLFDSKGIENPSSIASITFSLAIGITFFLSLVAGICTDKFGIRLTTIVGGAIATLGVFLSSLYYSQPEILATTMGFMFGAGASLAYTPSLVILGHYFHKYIGIVNGFVTAGSSVFTILITYILNVIIVGHDLKMVFQVLSGFMAVLMLCGALFKPVMPDVPKVTDVGVKNRREASFINLEIWKNKRYVIWALAIPLGLFGYFVPYVHLVEFVKKVLGEDVNSQILVQCIGGSSGIGRLAFGFIADRPWVNRIMLQQISFFCIGVLTMLLVVVDKFWMFIVVSLLMGLFDGCFISLLGPIAFDIVGPTGASQAIGCLLALCSIPLTLGPYFAGLIYDKMGSYFIPFLCSGFPPIVGAIALFSIRLVELPTKGGVGSPVKEATEMKNNSVAANSDIPNSSVPEAQALMSDNQNGGTDLLQVDVRHLVNLQRESSV